MLDGTWLLAEHQLVVTWHWGRAHANACTRRLHGRA